MKSKTHNSVKRTAVQAQSLALLGLKQEKKKKKEWGHDLKT